MKLAEGAIGDLDGSDLSVLAPTQGTFRVVSVQTSADSTSFGATSSSTQPAASSSGTASSANASSSARQFGSPREKSAATLTRIGTIERSGGGGNAHHGAAGNMRFIDKDEHVYFWFPLLAGLSELTFDPRPEIRNGALEVLFDTLKYHGASFAASFWRRIFDSVLLPIFDHVRAEVTDTTTFTSEKRRQQEDAWLYETCTRCLQHLIDVFVLFYDETSCLLQQMLDLLSAFMDRTHPSLAAVGVAALVRLLNTAAPYMDVPSWGVATDAVLSILQDITPNASELLTPPTRMSMVAPGQSASGLGGAASSSSASSEISPASPGPPSTAPPSTARASSMDSAGGGPEAGGSARTSGGGSSTGASSSTRASIGGLGQGQGMQQVARTYSLREGVGARRLAKFRGHAAVQLLLVQVRGGLGAWGGTAAEAVGAPAACDSTCLPVCL